MFDLVVKKVALAETTLLLKGKNLSISIIVKDHSDHKVCKNCRHAAANHAFGKCNEWDAKCPCEKLDIAGISWGTQRIVAGDTYIWILKSGELDQTNPENWKRIQKADILEIVV